MRRRSGFTIPELLIAMALIIFIMYILAEAFAAGSGAFRNLKAIGDMNEKLRTTSSVLRRYLAADHFEGKRRLSDPNFWSAGPPSEGFFRIWQDADSVNEGADLDGNPSYSSVNHGLHFAVKLRGNNRGDFFRTSLPAAPSMPSSLLLLPYPDTRFQDPSSNIFCAPWAEVAIFLRATGDVTDDPDNPAGSQPLYSLYLRQKLLIPDNSLVTAVGKVPYQGYTNGQGKYVEGYTDGNYAEMSCFKDPLDPTNLYFNSPGDVTMPARRLTAVGRTALGLNAGQSGDLANAASPATYPTLADEPKGLYAGNDILLTNVLSFDVRVLLPYNQWAAYWNSLGIPQANWPLYDFVSLWERSALDPNPNNGVVQQFSGVTAATPPRNPVFTRFLNNNVNTPNPNFPGYAFDTWSAMRDDSYDYSGWSTAGAATSAPLYQNAQGQNLQILAIQITIRIWDSNTKQTRQTSLVVDM